MSFSESQEEINGKDIPLKIYQKNEVTINITTEEATPDGHRAPSPPGQTGLVRVDLGPDGNEVATNRERAANEMELGVVTKVYHGV